MDDCDALDLVPEQREFRGEVREFLRAHLPEHLRAAARATPTVFAEPDISREWQQTLYEKGWLTYNWPREFGGTGWSLVQRYIFEKECALADAPDLPVQGLKLLASVLQVYGSSAQQAHYLPRILSGEHYWCQGFSESGAGSDLSSLRTRATRHGSEYLLNGAKLWTTHAHFADHMFCLARTDTTVKPQRGITFFLLDMRQPGVRVRPIRTLAGDHELNEVFLDNARVSADDRLGEEGQGWTIAKSLLENERSGSCLAPRILAGIARLRMHAAAEPSGAGSNLLTDPMFVGQLARLELEAQALEVTELRVLEDVAGGAPPGAKSTIIKLVASELHGKVGTLGASVFGYAGLQLETRRPLYGPRCPQAVYSPAAQIAAPKYLNGQAWTIFGGTSEVQRSIIAKTVLWFDDAGKAT